MPLYVQRDREEVKIYLKRRSLPTELREKKCMGTQTVPICGKWLFDKNYDFTGRGRAIKHCVKSTSPSALFRRKVSWQKLSCVRWLLQRELRQRRKKYRDILYKRLAKREALWTPAELTPLDILRILLGNLRGQNLELCKHISKFSWLKIHNFITCSFSGCRSEHNLY